MAGNAVNRTIRSLLSSSTRVSSLAPTNDALLGTERLLLASMREGLCREYASQLSSGKFDVVTTSLDTNVSFLNANRFFTDSNRKNDISYYEVGKGKKGLDEETGKEFSFEVQANGGSSRLGKIHFCIPRSCGVSKGEQMRFAAYLAQLNMIELQSALAENSRESETENDDLQLLGSSIAFGDVPPSYVEFQILEVVNQGEKPNELLSTNPDVFVVHGCDTDEQRGELKDIISRNGKRTELKQNCNTVGLFIPDEEESEVGFDIPFLLMREGNVDEVL